MGPSFASLWHWAEQPPEPRGRELWDLGEKDSLGAPFRGPPCIAGDLGCLEAAGGSRDFRAGA